MTIHLHIVTDFASWENFNLKLWNLAYFVPKFDKKLNKYSIGFNVNSVFEKIWWFVIEIFNYLNSSIIWFDSNQKNVELKLKFSFDKWVSFLIWLFELTL